MSEHRPHNIGNLAKLLLPLLLETGECALVSQAFINGGSPKRENWEKVLHAVFHPPVMRVALNDFLDAPPTIHPYVEWRLPSELETMSGYIELYGHKDVPARFDPELDLTHFKMAQRILHAQLMDGFDILEKNPHFVMTLVHMQGFFGGFIGRLQQAMMQLIPEEDVTRKADRVRVTKIFERLNNVTLGNQELIVGIMGFQFLIIHKHVAEREGRALGDYALADFIAFDRYVASGKLFRQKGEICPFSSSYRLAMQGKDETTGLNVSGLQLWRLHQHVAPIVPQHTDKLHEAVREGRSKVEKAIRGHVTPHECPHIRAIIQQIG